MQISAIAGAGLVQAVRRFDASAQRVVRAGEAGSPVHLAEEAVEQIGAKHAFTANLSVLKAADDMVKQLLDITV
jgi:flagellar basal body rod protein FlgC